MRVVLTTVGSRGDVEPVAGLAAALLEQGAQVRVCAPPDEDVVAVVHRAGAEHVPLGRSVRSVVAGDRPPTVEDAYRFAAELVDARFEVLTAAAEGADVLLATGLLPAGVRTVAETLGVRYVFAAFAVYGLPSRHFPPGRRPGPPPPADQDDLRELWRHDTERVDALYAGPLNRHHARLGLPPVVDVHSHVLGGGPGLLAADLVLCPWRRLVEVGLRQTGAWILPDRRPLAEELVDFLDAGEPPVYVGFGSMGLHGRDDLAEIAVESARALGRRVVLAGGWAGLTPPDGTGDCLVIGEVNQQALFARVAAVVHHGGAGTTTTATRAGVPQVVVPQLADQPSWAERVDDLGVGVAHPGPAPTVESLTAALRTALEPTTAQRARAVGGAIRTDGAHEAARFLLAG
ncbi:glycosyltransferase [Desertihabitans aurantiacus]|uniref:glycosyltransferase n=1 Tax=Desertihabitans aurantiacus TaxID=2282477 RepID=UPI000DF7E987|nr:glycosyltransferase [Desertihabitans aurantiacus]